MLRDYKIPSPNKRPLFCIFDYHCYYLRSSCSQTSLSHYHIAYTHNVYSSNSHPHVRRRHPPPRRIQRDQRQADARWDPWNTRPRGHHPHRPPWPIPQLRQLPSHPTPSPRLCACLWTREHSARYPVFEDLSPGGWYRPFIFSSCTHFTPSLAAPVLGACYPEGTLAVPSIVRTASTPTQYTSWTVCPQGPGMSFPPISHRCDLC